ncbi:Adhesion G-protein coupled receptor G6 [Bagarius yarrelli]|uniref:Adhesion G-protein coupled receptor G6 n=1 Tax=Bagarius yarrelli TaxID=175774 RepID=A0A556TZP4_BAGYA|nr:Adhesion G-protein coupled receptor G6 [Bagarius yarrelli]
MLVTFHSDFSIQKKGFSVSYRQVAVALRNQKVALPQNPRDVVQVSKSVSMPSLSQFTTCFEIAAQSQTGSGIIFSYMDKNDYMAFGKSGNTVDLIIGNTTCTIQDIFSLTDLTSSMQQFCLTWSSSNGAVAIYFRGSYQAKLCPGSVGLRTESGGSFDLGRGKKQGHNYEGIIYNFRLWSFAMSSSQLSSLTCDTVGDVLDWDNSYWDIPPSYAQTDSTLSCTFLTTPTPSNPSTPSTATTNTIPTNSRTNVQTPSPATASPTIDSARTVKETAVVLWWLLRLSPRSAAGSSASPHSSQPPVAPAARSSKSSLGFISTPLIWPVRKKPETAVTQTPKYAAIHVTKAPPLPTKRVAHVSPEARTNAKNLTGRPTYSHVLWPHNQTEKSFHVASVSMRKNKPLPTRLDLSESTEDSSEELDISVFGSDTFMYDIDFDENLFSLFELEASYSLDGGLATTSPNTSLLKKASVPASTDKAAFQRAETQNSKMLIESPRESDDQMVQYGLSRLKGHTAEPLSISKPSISTTLSGSTSTVNWALPGVTGTQCIFTGCIRVSAVQRPTHTAHGQTGTLEQQYTVTQITPSITASLRFSSDYIPGKGLITEPLTVSQIYLQSSFALGAGAPSPMEVHHGVNISPSQTLPFGTFESFLSSGAGQSNVDSLQRLHLSHVNPNPNTDPNSNPESNPYPNPENLEPFYSQEDQSYSVNISMSVGFSAQLLSDRWSISPSSPLNSSLDTQMDASFLRFRSIEPVHIYYGSDLISSSGLLDALKATEEVNISGEGIHTGNQTAVSNFTASITSPFLSHAIAPDLHRRPFLSEGSSNDFDDSQERLMIPQLSTLLSDETGFASQSEEDSGESTTGSEKHIYIFNVSASSFPKYKDLYHKQTTTTSQSHKNLQP